MTSSPMVTLTIVVFIAISSSSFSNAGSPAVFLLGDSQLDIGTNNFVLNAVAKAKYPHYGVDFFNSTPSGRFSNGLNIADYIAKVVFGDSVTSPPAYLSLFFNEIYSEKKLAKVIDFDASRRRRHTTNGFGLFSLLEQENPAIGINFASAGGTILDLDVGYHALPLTEQISQLIFVHGNLSATIGSWRTQLLFAKSPFFISMGGNDIFLFPLIRAIVERDQYIATLIQTYNDTLRSLYNIGVRKFGIINVPYVGSTPLMRVSIFDGNYTQITNDLAKLLNEKLECLMQDMMRQSKGMIYSFGNTYDISLHLYHTPERYNIKNVQDACCGLGKFHATIICNPLATLCPNRDDYLYFDSLHFTQHAAQIIVEALAFGGPEHARPINFAKLASM